LKKNGGNEKTDPEETNKSFEIDTKNMKMKFGLTFIKNCFKVTARFVFPKGNKTRSFVLMFGEKNKNENEKL